MPELPEVETVRRGLEPVLRGATIVRVRLNRPDLRYPFPDRFAAMLNGATIIDVTRKAKYLLIYLNNDHVIICHLGMSGCFRIVGHEIQPSTQLNVPNPKPQHDHVIFTLHKGSQEHQVIYNDPRRFGFMDLCPVAQMQTNRHLIKLGVEPTANHLSADLINTLFVKSKLTLKAALLDQRLIAGLGNIYVCEALWRAQLSPKRLASSICGKNPKPSMMRENLCDSIKAVISEAIEAGGSTLSDHRQPTGELGYFQHQFDVYGRHEKACRRSGCDGTIDVMRQHGRSTYYCPTCQK